MQYQATTTAEDQPALVPAVDRTRWRHACRELTLKSALQKRAAGVVNGQVAVPAGGQLKVPTPRG
jgi:hypothetical protein